MNPPLRLQSFARSPLDAGTACALLAAAQALRNGTLGGAPLRGKNIALIGSADSDAVRRFSDAAQQLGARVSRVDPVPAWQGAEARPGRDAARLLESMYDAVDCAALPAGFAQQLQSLVAMPVYAGLARADHPIFELLDALPRDGATPEQRRRLLVQAALVHTLA